MNPFQSSVVSKYGFKIYSYLKQLGRAASRARNGQFPDVATHVMTGAAMRVSLLKTPAASFKPTLSSFAVLIFLLLTLIGNGTTVASSSRIVLVAVLVSDLAARLPSPKEKVSNLGSPNS